MAIRGFAFRQGLGLGVAGIVALTTANCLRPPQPPACPTPLPTPLPDYAGDVGGDGGHCVAGDRLCVHFVNNLGGLFVSQQIDVLVDDTIVYSRVAVQPGTPVVVYSGSPEVGTHTVLIRFRFRGHGCGERSYLRGYKFEMKSHDAVDVADDTPIDLVAIAHLRDGERLEHRPAVTWEEVQRQ